MFTMPYIVRIKYGKNEMELSKLLFNLKELIGTFIINMLVKEVDVGQQFIIIFGAKLYRIYHNNTEHCNGKGTFFFLSHHIIVKSSKCQPRCNITIYWKGIDLLGHCGDDILSLAQKQRHLLAIKYIKFCLYQ